MLLERSRFGENLAAYLHYVGSLVPADAVPALRGTLGDGAWLKEPEAWASAAWTLVNEQKWPKRAMVGELAEAMTRLTKSEEVRAVHLHFAQAVRGLAEETAPEYAELLKSLVAWFVQVARPGDARIAADALFYAEHATPGPSASGQFVGVDFARRAQLLPVLSPLAVWLLENGAGVLRGERADTLPFIAEIVLACDPPRVVNVLQYARATERPTRFWPPRAQDASRPSIFWPAVETALGLGAAHSLVLDLVARLPSVNWNDREIFAPCLEDGFPLARAVLVEGLTDGRFEGPKEVDWWKLLLSLPPDVLGRIRFHDLASLERVLGLFEQSALFGAQPSGENADPAWGKVLVAEYIRLVDFSAVRAGMEGARERLVRMTRFPQLAPSVREGLKAALGELATVTDVTLAGDVLEQSDSHAATRAALLTLPAWKRTKSASSPQQTEELRAWLERFLHRSWPDDVGGVNVSAVLGSARRLEFVTLDHEDKIRVNGEKVLLDKDAMEGIAAGADPERRRVLGALYFFHELVHLVQGIGDKARVVRLRAAGSETTLLHLDLAADHIAAQLAHHAEGRWSMAFLKDVQGRSLKAFPVRWMHTAASAARKAQRLVSLRLDALVQGQHQWARRLGGGYAYAEYGVGGGGLLALTSGPPPMVLADASLSASEARLLHEIADEGKASESGIARVDEVLGRLFR